MNPHIVLGVSGGIAAYKAVEVLRRLIDKGARVQVVMTRGAREFVAPLTFATLSGRPVHCEVWGDGNAPAVDHVALAGMNAVFYLAIDRLPLATVGAIEFLGPIAIAVVEMIVPKYLSEARVLIEGRDNVFLRPNADKDLIERVLSKIQELKEDDGAVMQSESIGK